MNMVEFAVCVLRRAASRRRNSYAYRDEKKLDLEVSRAFLETDSPGNCRWPGAVHHLLDHDNGPPWQFRATSVNTSIRHKRC
jgi:hypothetical protein